MISRSRAPLLFRPTADLDRDIIFASDGAVESAKKLVGVPLQPVVVFQRVWRGGEGVVAFQF